MEQRPMTQEQQQALEGLIGGRQVGLDGPDDVRRHEELGPPPGSIEAARAQGRFEAYHAQEEEGQGDQDETLTARAEALLEQRAEQEAERNLDQGMER